MRLICPNCGAKYDVADDVIPQGGRDVQCSNCTKTWFQMDAQSAPAAEPEPAETSDSAGTPPAEDGEEKPAARRPLDNAVAEILRKEAARDGHLTAARNQAPPATQESIPTKTADAEETRKRIASMTQSAGGAAAAAAAGAAADSGTNLRSVPDIHEINAALRARAEAADTSGLTAAEKAEAQERKGFRRGFFIVLLLIALLLLPYFFADQIVANLPQTQPYMASYVLMVDQVRVWLDTQFAAVQAMISGLMNSDG